MNEPKIIAWIVEPKGDGKPYLTLNPEVAAKREKKGDFVTPYASKNPEPKEQA